MISAFSAIRMSEGTSRKREPAQGTEQGGGFTAEYEPREPRKRVKREGTMRSRAAAKQDHLYKPTFKL